MTWSYSELKHAGLHLHLLYPTSHSQENIY